MIILDYQKQNHNPIIHAAVEALKRGKSVAYPTDTSYGLAVDATNIKAIKKLYRIKQRESKKPVHVIVPSLAYAKKVVKWNNIAAKLVKKFWPGPLTIILGLRGQGTGYRMLSAGSGFMGVRFPNNKFALDLCKTLGRPITTTSANPPSGIGGDDSYSAEAIISQFAKYKYRPDIIINAGKLPIRKPSTMVKIDGGKIFILRKGPISEKEIKATLRNKLK